MKAIHELNKYEIPLCLLFNRANHFRLVSLFFSAISRLANGVFWYVLILMLPIIHGLEAVTASLHMVISGLLGLAVYKWLKVTTRRVRPYNFHNNIFQSAPALDKFSFPSGHIQHAVSFTLVLLYYYPEWALLVVPFTMLVALSRIVLGLHYPSDVAIGAIIGFVISQGSIIVLQLINASPSDTVL